MVAFFYETFERHPIWETIRDTPGVLRVIGAEDWRSRPFLSPIVPVVTGTGRCRSLAARLLDSGFLAHAVQHPIVQPDQERVRIMIHADNNMEQIKKMIDVIMSWGEENTYHARVVEAPPTKGN